MFNNPDNLTPEQYLETAVRPEDCCYIIFGAEARRNGTLYFTINRVIWDRDDNRVLSEDHAFFWQDSPAWLTGD